MERQPRVTHRGTRACHFYMESKQAPKTNAGEEMHLFVTVSDPLSLPVSAFAFPLSLPTHLLSCGTLVCFKEERWAHNVSSWCL